MHALTWHDAAPFIGLVLIYGLAYGGGALIDRWMLRRSESWRARSRVSRRLLSRLPGAAVGMLLGVALIALLR